MKRLFALAVMALCSATMDTVLAHDALQGARYGPGGMMVGEQLLSARTKLVKHGWRPVRRHVNDGYEYSGAELQLTRSKILEVDSCSADSSRCILYYKKADTCLRVDTIGEKLKDMTVTRWIAECPDAPPKPGKAITPP
jgi:hypothetical protein